MNASIIIPVYKPDKNILKMALDMLKKQDFSGKIEIIKVEEGLGLADSLNWGIKKAKYPIIVTLHQDCVPSSKDWLKKLTAPLKNKNVVTSTSKIEMPYEFWNKFDPIAKILSEKEQGTFTTLMDEKGCAYKKDVLLKTGLFDGKNFRTAGEDYDMYLKLVKFGKVVHTEAKVIHYHEHTWKNRIKKEIQLSNGSGACIRIYGKKVHWRHWCFIRATPIFGWPFFLHGLNVKKLGFLLSLLALPLYLFVNLLYSYGFWKGFLIGRQTV
jgi:glycosyltransferase involved in cell wall biosynthesis